MDSIRLLLPQNHSIPGIKFSPTDVEAITYIKKRNSGQAFSPNPIYEVSFYNHTPDYLSEMFKPNGGDDCWFFFTQLNKKYRGGRRLDRAVDGGCGYWKADGIDKKIHLPNGGTHVGYRKTLVYYVGKYRNGVNTEWRLHELTEKKASEPVKTDTMMLDGWVVCKLYKVKKLKKILCELQKQSSSLDATGLNQPSSSSESPHNTSELGTNNNVRAVLNQPPCPERSVGINSPATANPAARAGDKTVPHEFGYSEAQADEDYYKLIEELLPDSVDDGTNVSLEGLMAFSSRQIPSSILSEGALIFNGLQKQSSSLDTTGPNQPCSSSESPHNPWIGRGELGTNRNVRDVLNQPPCPERSVGINSPASEKDRQVYTSPEILGPDVDKPWSFNNNVQQISPNDSGLSGDDELYLLAKDCLGDEFMSYIEHDFGANRDDFGGDQ